MTDRVMDRCGVGWCLTKAQSLPGLSRVWFCFGARWSVTGRQAPRLGSFRDVLYLGNE